MATTSIPTTELPPLLADVNPDSVIQRGLKRTLPCKLTEHEFVLIAKQRVDEEALRDQVVADFDRLKAKHKAQLEEMDAKITKARGELHSGHQDRTVICTSAFMSHADGSSWVITYRTDTGAVVEQRPATPAEAQRHLPGVDGPAPLGGPILDRAPRMHVVSDEPDDGVGDVTNIDELGEQAAAEDDEGDDDKPKAKRGRKAPSK